MSLTRCLKKMGKLISPEDAAQLRSLQADYRADGMSGDEATRAAVQSLLDGAQADRDGLLERIRAQGGDEEQQITQTATRTAPAPMAQRRGLNPNPNLIEQVTSPQFSLAGTMGGSSIDATIDKAVKPSLKHTSMRERFGELVQSINRGAFEEGKWWIRQMAFDSSAPIERLEVDQYGQLLDAKHSAYKMASLTKNIGGVMQQVFKSGIPIYEDGQFQIDPERTGLMEALSPLFTHPEGDKTREFEAWAVAHRLNQRSDVKSHLSEQEIQDLLALDQQYDGLFSRINDAWQEINQQALQLAIDRGAISQDMADMWSKYDYIPMFRAMEDLESIDSGVSGPRTKVGLDGQSVDSRRLRGHDTARVENVIENMVLNLAKILDASYKNEAMRRIVALADGGVMEKIPMKHKVIRLKTRELASALVKGGMIVAQPPARIQNQGHKAMEKWMLEEGEKQVRAMTEEQLESWNMFFRPQAPMGESVVSVMVKGKAQYYRVHDMPLLKAIQQIGHTQIAGILGKLFRGPRQLLTEMVTLDPGFMIANWIRDFGSTMVAVDAARPWSMMADAVGSMGEIFNDEGLMNDLRAAGGTTTGWYNPLKPDVINVFDEALPFAQKKGGTVVKSAKELYKMYRSIGRVSEQSNRAAVAKAVLAQGGSMAEAAWQAQDVLNFNQRGSGTAVQIISEVVPFFNARLQGLYKLFHRAATGSGQMSPAAAAQKIFFLKAAALVGAALMYAAYMEDDEDFERLPEWDKDTNLHIFVGEGENRQHFRIPKPFEVGLLFMTVPERILRNWMGADQDKVTAQSLARGILDTLAMNPTPQLVKPLYEQWANRSMFTGRPIVNLNLQNLRPEAQYHPWTSETARAIADVSGNILPEWAKDFVPDFVQSPVRIESLIRSYTGTLGAYVTQVADYFVRDVRDLPDAPAGMVGGSNPLTPVIEGVTRRFYRGDPLEARGNRYADQMYASLQKANSMFRTYNQYVAQGRVQMATDLMGENMNLFSYRKLLNDVNNQLRELNTVERAIRYQTGITPEEKRAKIDQLTRTRNQVLQSVAPILEIL